MPASFLTSWCRTLSSGRGELLPSKSVSWLPTSLARLDPVTFSLAGERGSQGRIRGFTRPCCQQRLGQIIALGRGRHFFCGITTHRLPILLQVTFTLVPIIIHSQTHWSTKLDLSGIISLVCCYLMGVSRCLLISAGIVNMTPGKIKTSPLIFQDVMQSI